MRPPRLRSRTSSTCAPSASATNPRLASDDARSRTGRRRSSRRHSGGCMSIAAPCARTREPRRSCSSSSSAAWFRLSGANWDEGTHLHPDERYIASVSNVIDFPCVAGDLPGRRRVAALAVQHAGGSRRTPYGTLPIFATKAVARGRGSRRLRPPLPRRPAARRVLDLATMVLVFLIARALLLTGVGPRRAFQGGLLAAALYAVTVAAIQASHFFTTDVWLVFFGTLAVYLGLVALRSSPGRVAVSWAWSRPWASASALPSRARRAACSCVVPVLVALRGQGRRRRGRRRRDGTRRPPRARQLAVLVDGVPLFRLVSPYSFAHSNWLDLRLGAASEERSRRSATFSTARPSSRRRCSGSFRRGSPTRSRTSSSGSWESRSGCAPSLALGVLAVDAVRAQARVERRRSPDDASWSWMRAMLLAYVVVVFLYMATRFQHMGRYLLPIVPLLAVAASYGMHRLFAARPRVLAAARRRRRDHRRSTRSRSTPIYRSATTRLAAQRVDRRRTCPRVRGSPTSTGTTRCPVGGLAAGYTLVDRPGLRAGRRDEAAQAVRRRCREPTTTSLSSPRAWRTIGRLPDRYPLMVRYYERAVRRAARLRAGRVVLVASRDCRRRARRPRRRGGVLGLRPSAR